MDQWELLKMELIDDSKVENGIYSSLTRYISKFSNPPQSKVMPENNIGDGTMEHPYQFPYRTYSREIEDFVKDICFERSTRSISYPDMYLSCSTMVYNGMRMQ